MISHWKLDAVFRNLYAGKANKTRESISKIRRSKTNGKGNDKDSAGSPHGGEARNHQQAGRSRPGAAGRDRGERDQEEWRVHHSWDRQAGEGGAQGAAGSQSADRRNDQDQGQDRGEVPRGQGCKGHDRTGEEVVRLRHELRLLARTCRTLQKPSRMTPERLLLQACE